MIVIRPNGLQLLFARIVGFFISLVHRSQCPFDRVVCICDYSDMARMEIELGLRQVLPQWVQIHFLPVSNFNTVEAGFALGQLALTVGNNRTLFFVNVAPRKDDPNHRRSDNSGEPFVCGRLRNGAVVLSTIGGHCLSWVREHFEELRRMKNGAKRSQFRSRDWLIPAVRQLTAGDLSFLGTTLLKLGDIPELPTGIVAGYVDNYGNIKLSLRERHLRTLTGFREGRATLKIRVLSKAGGSAELQAYAGTGIFDVLEGEAVLAPGSSTHGVDDPFVEIVVRSASAAAALADSASGTRLALKPGTSLLVEFEPPQMVARSATDLPAAASAAANNGTRTGAVSSTH